MANSDLIDSLIATYRNLNLAIRPLSDAQAMQAGSGGKSLRDLLIALRDNELQVSQQLKLMTLGEGASAGDTEIAPVASDLNFRSILSEFGTAREAILALIRELPEEEWTAQRAGPTGQTSIQKVVQDLVDNDRKAMSEIEPLVKSRAA